MIATEAVLPGIVEPAGIELRTRTLPAPGPGQALIAVEASGVSFAEQSMRRGRYPGQPKFPFVPGYDLVGTVTGLGPDTDPALLGRRVAAMTKTGGWASHALLTAADLVPVPAGVDPGEAETLVVNGVTAWQMLHRKAKVRPGQTILVHGASGGVGTVLGGAVVEHAAQRQDGDLLQPVGRAPAAAGRVPGAYPSGSDRGPGPAGRRRADRADRRPPAAERGPGGDGTGRVPHGVRQGCADPMSARRTVMAVPATTPEAGPRTRNRRGEGARLRTEILAAAAELLDETGDEQAVTLRAVARRIGISAPSIYSHFADRQAILLALAQQAFAELTERLTQATGADPVERLRAVCAAYLDFAATRPQRYRVMFGGLWNAAEAVDQAAITEAEVLALGQDALGVLTTTLAGCVAAGRSSSTDAEADAVALWLGLHGLAHQRTVSRAFPWPADITERLIVPLAHLTPVGS
jgi:AcrR family transcriptional regulator